MVGVPLVLVVYTCSFLLPGPRELKKERDHYRHLDDCHNLLDYFENWIMTDVDSFRFVVYDGL